MVGSVGSWLSTYLLHPLTGNGYAWWSGAGSDLGEAAILLAFWHHLNCAEQGCWRVGHPGRGHRCRRHHNPGGTP